MSREPRRLVVFGLVVQLVLVACDDDAPVSDAAVDADAPDGDATSDVIPPLEISPAALPTMTPCPAGWREVVDPDAPVTHCAPFEEDGPSRCPSGQARFPGDDACARIGPACPPSGAFPEDLPAGAMVVYVRSGAAGGDGSEAAPYGDLATAVDAAPDDAVIAVAAGEYTEELVVTRDVRIWGACTEGVVLTGTSIGGVIQVLGATAELKNLTFRGSTRGVAVNGADTVIEDVVFEEIGGLAISALGGSITVRRTLVAASETEVAEGGLLLSDTVALLDHVAVTGRLSFPFSQMIGELHLADSVFADVTNGGMFPVLFIDGTTNATIERTALIRSTPLGARLQNLESLTIRDSYFEGPRGTVTPPMGLVFGTVADGVIERVTFVRPRDVGLGLSEAPATLRASDVVIVDAAASDLGDFGYGIGLVDATSLDIERAYIARSWGAGIVADGTGSVVTARDLTIVSTRSNGLGLLGRALQAQAGGTVTAERVHLEDNREATVVAANAESEVQLTDAVIRTTAIRACAPACSGAGFGVGAYEGGHATLRRFRLEAHSLAGAQIATEGAIDLSDGEVLDNPVGVNVQVDGYDVGRLTEGVSYRNNGVNLDSESLPVPSASVSGL